MNAKHQILVAKIKDGNVQSINGHMITTQTSVERFACTGQVWMTRETALSVGLMPDSLHGGVTPCGHTYRIVTQEIIEKNF